MADISDVLNVLAELINSALYPAPNPAADTPSTAGMPCKVYPGWPDSTELVKALAAGQTQISIFPKAEERVTTRYSTAAQVTVDPAPTLTAAISGQTITIGGTVSIPQNVMLLVNGLAYTYAVQANDTLTSIAAALVALLGGSAANTGPVINLSTSARLQAARVGANGTVASEYRRQERVIQITIWSNTPANRDAVAKIIDPALAQVEFLTMPDGFGARLLYQGSPMSDVLEKETLYRRDFNYRVEYATTVVQQLMAVTAPFENIGASADPTNQTVKTVNF